MIIQSEKEIIVIMEMRKNHMALRPYDNSQTIFSMMLNK